MEPFQVTERELRDVCRRLSQRWGYDKNVKWSYNARGYILVEFGNDLQHHFRFDLAEFDNRQRQKLVNGNYNYKIVSVHVKGEESYADRQYSYLYLVHTRSGVWQPVWGYLKDEGGRRARKLELTANELAAAYRDAHALMEELSAATRSAHGVAMGPTQGAGATAGDVGIVIEW